MHESINENGKVWLRSESINIRTTAQKNVKKKVTNTFPEKWDISRQKLRHLPILNFVCREVGQVWDGGLGAAALPRHGLCLQH